MNSTTLAVLDCNEEVASSIINTPLRESVEKALENYLLQLDGHTPVDLYPLVLKEIEAPLFKVIMRITKNNQSKAAKILGLSRATLRKKLKQYNLDN